MELRRLCCIDNTPKNTESYFISKTLILLRKIGIRKVLSLADPNYGHNGGIYKASNFTLLGEERGGGSRDIFIDGETGREASLMRRLKKTSRKVTSTKSK